MYFKRGFIIKGAIPPQDARPNTPTPPPSFVLHGEHYLVMLHDSDNADVDPRTVLVVPITSAEGEQRRAHREGRSIFSSYIPLAAADYPFLDHDSYVSTSQIMPINRNWLINYVDQIHEDKMAEIDLQVVHNVGLMETVSQMAEQIYELRRIREAAAAAQQFTTDSPS